MFTGIIEELGIIKKIETTKSGKRFVVMAEVVMDDLAVGDSISVNGVCLTVVKIENKSFHLDLVDETLAKSNLGDLAINTRVNLERALTLSARLGGHLLQGHVETVGVIVEKETTGDGATIIVGLSPEWMRYCIPKGSIGLDGISLTIAALKENFVTVALIPHTLEMTTLGFKDKGDSLNIETDIVGKYIDRLLSFDDDEERDETYLTGLLNWGYGES